MNIFPMPKRTMTLFNSFSDSPSGEAVSAFSDRVMFPLLQLCVALERELETSQKALRIKTENLEACSLMLGKADERISKLEARGEITLICDDRGQLVAVTRTDAEGRVLETLWELPKPYRRPNFFSWLNEELPKKSNSQG